MSSAWAEAKTGCVIDLLRDGQTANPILVLDEIDKVSKISKYDPPLGALYTLLKHEAAERFVGYASNASHVLYVATANDLDSISAPLLSQFVVLEINQIEGQHRQAVCKSIYQAVLEKEGVARLNNDVMAALADFTPRQIKQMLIRAGASVARHPRIQGRIVIETDDLVKPASESSRSKLAARSMSPLCITAIILASRFACPSPRPKHDSQIVSLSPTSGKCLRKSRLSQHLRKKFFQKCQRASRTGRRPGGKGI